MKFIILFTTLLFLTVTLSIAQSITGEVELQTEITALLGEEEAGDIAERIALLAERPVAINSGDEEEIARLFFLTEFQVKVLADHVKTKGHIISVYEIALLPGFDQATAKLIEPFITLEDVKELRSCGGGVTTVLSTVMFKQGSSQEDNSGARAVIRLHHSGIKFSYGFTAENDPGESFTLKGAAGADFLSAHAMYQGDGFVSRIIAGDYSLRFGEGLVFNNSVWQGGWLTSPSFMAGRAVLSPYTSTDENNFFRGVGLTLGRLTNGIVIFVSSNAIDGRVEYNTADSTAYVTTLVKGGLHNTESGLKARNSVTENLAGIHLSTGNDNIRAGFTAAATLFSLPIMPDSSQADNLFKFRDKRLLNIGADIKAGSGNLLFYAEAAYSLAGSWASVTGIRVLPSSRVTLNVMARYLSPDYHAFHSGIYGAGSAASNEMGLAGNIHVEAARHIFLSAGVDISRYPWLRYRSSSPSAACRTELMGEYTPSDNLNCRISWSISQREYDVSETTGLPGTQEYRRQQLSVAVVYSHSSAVRLTSRAGWCRLDATGEKGWLLSQDVLLTLKNIPLRLWCRYALFTTGGYDSRLYAYENDMLHSFSIPALYGDGNRTYLMAEWEITTSLMVRAKYSVTAREAGNTRSTVNEARVQMKVMF